MSCNQADIPITATVNLLAGADDASAVKLTAKLLSREEASQVFNGSALQKLQSPASGDPVLIENWDAHINVSLNVFLKLLSAETIDGFVNFCLSLPENSGHVLRPQAVFKIQDRTERKACVGCAGTS